MKTRAAAPRAGMALGRQLTFTSYDENATAGGMAVAFRVFAIAATLAALEQVALGGVVRVTGSGMGCGPDWPTCNGEWFPPLNDPATLIEYSHRLSATALGFLVVGAAILAFMRRRRVSPVAFYASMAAVPLVIAAALLGWATVATELGWGYRLLHLTIAELLAACLMASVIFGWRARTGAARGGGFDAAGNDETARRLMVGAVVGTLLIILSGSFMVGYGAGTSCADWPLCRGSLLPDGAAYLIHMGHRYVAALVGAVIVAACWRAWVVSADGSPIRVAAAFALAAFAVQTGMGAAVVWSGFDNEFKAIHLSLATAVWIALVATLALYFIPSSAAAETAGAPASGARRLSEG